MYVFDGCDLRRSTLQRRGFLTLCVVVLLSREAASANGSRALCWGFSAHSWFSPKGPGFWPIGCPAQRTVPFEDSQSAIKPRQIGRMSLCRPLPITFESTGYLDEPFGSSPEELCFSLLRETQRSEPEVLVGFGEGCVIDKCNTTTTTTINIVGWVSDQCFFNRSTRI